MTKIEEKKVSDLIPDNQNINTHTQRGRGIVEHSVRKYGIGRGIVAAGKDTDTPQIIGGHLTTEIVGSLDMDDVIFVHTNGEKLVVTVRDDIAPNSAEAIALGLIDNESQKQSYNPDLDILAAVMADPAMQALKDEDKILAGIVEGMGLKAETQDAEPQIDRAAELLEKWQVKTGDLWQIGEHRLICGDCTDAAVVARVMGNDKADMTFIDPPYGVDYEGGAQNEKKRKKLEGDETGDLYMPVLKICKEASKKHAPMYVWFADRCGKPVYDAVEAIGYEVRAMIIWNKLDAHYGAFMAQYMQKHEPCLYIVDGKSNFIGASNEVTVWDVKQPSKNEFHPTQKPIELAMRAIGNHDAKNIIDFCVGSGTTMLACENLRRVCFACEKDPKFIAVTLERMSQAFPALEIKRLE